MRSVIRVTSKSYYCERGGRVKEVEDGRRGGRREGKNGKG